MRCEYELNDYEFTDISNVELRTCIECIVHTMPDAGQNMIKGILRGEGVHVSVTRIRECISVVQWNLCIVQTPLEPNYLS